MIKPFPKTLLFFLFLILSGRTTAQEYRGDILIMGSDTLCLMDLPLNFNRELTEYLKDHTASSRSGSYMGIWEIRNNRLVLLELLKPSEKPIGRWQKIPMTGIFDKYRQDGIVTAVWFYGILACGKGQILKKGKLNNLYCYFEEEVELTFAQGEMTGQSLHRHRLTPAPLSVDEAAALVKNNVDKELFAGIAGGSKCIIYPDTHGKIDRAELLFAPIQQDNSHLYGPEIRRCLELVPGWEVLMRDDEILPVEIYLWWNE